MSVIGKKKRQFGEAKIYKRRFELEFVGLVESSECYGGARCLYLARGEFAAQFQSEPTRPSVI